MNPVTKGLVVFLGGGTGATLRFFLGSWIYTRTGSDFPWHTLVINVIGSLLFGLLLPQIGREDVRLLVTVGVLGGFTTFSTFSFETIFLLKDRPLSWAVGYLALSVIGSVGACGLGLWASGKVSVP